MLLVVMLLAILADSPYPICSLGLCLSVLPRLLSLALSRSRCAFEAWHAPFTYQTAILGVVLVVTLVKHAEQTSTRLWHPPSPAFLYALSEGHSQAPWVTIVIGGFLIHMICQDDIDKHGN